MMNKKLLLLALGATTLLTFSSCDQNDDSLMTNSSVIKAFNTLFPTSSQIDWDKEGNDWVAEFFQQGIKKEAWFNTDGQWLMTETDVIYTSLPQAVKDSFEGSQWATWQVEDIDFIEKSTNESYYILEVENNQSERDLYYAPDGTFIKDEISR